MQFPTVLQLIPIRIDTASFDICNAIQATSLLNDSVKRLSPSPQGIYSACTANVKHFFTWYGKHFFTSCGKHFFTRFGKQNFTWYGKEFFTLSGKEIFTS